MVSREEYLIALEIVKLYRKQCLDDVSLSDYFVNNIDPESKFTAIASTRLSQAIMNSEFFSWSNDYTVKEVASHVNDNGLKKSGRIQVLAEN